MFSKRSNVIQCNVYLRKVRAEGSQYPVCTTKVVTAYSWLRTSANYKQLAKAQQHYYILLKLTHFLLTYASFSYKQLDKIYLYHSYLDKTLPNKGIKHGPKVHSSN